MFVCAGMDCVIVKSGRRICGSGAALANAPIVQDKAYFEMKIQSSGKFTIFTVLSRISGWEVQLLCLKGCPWYYLEHGTGSGYILYLLNLYGWSIPPVPGNCLLL